jgi:hypothetical protein
VQALADGLSPWICADHDALNAPPGAIFGRAQGPEDQAGNFATARKTGLPAALRQDASRLALNLSSPSARHQSVRKHPRFHDAMCPR